MSTRSENHSPLRRTSAWLIPVLLGALLLLLIAIPMDQWRKAPPAEPVRTATGEIVSAANLARLEAVQRQIRETGAAWRAGVTGIAHLSAEAFEGLLGARPPADEPEGLARFMSALPSEGRTSDLPSHWDWRDEGGVTGARHQGACGSCWAFAAAGALEGTLLVYDGRELDLSEQHALDCNPDGYGCSGGWMTSVYRLWRDTGALLESEVPYAGDDGRPCLDQDYTPSARVEAWSSVAFTRESLKRRVLVRPLAVAMHIYPDFQFYEGGVYSHEGSDPVNHAVTLVGWDDELSAWIIKNSWGTGWGEEGFAYVDYDCCRLGSYAHAIVAPVARAVRIHHRPIADTLGTGPFPLTAIVTSLAGLLDPQRVTLQVDTGAGFSDLHLTHLGGDGFEGSFAGELPGVAVGTTVRYYLEVTDTHGETFTLPAAGASEPFHYRTLRRVYAEDFESPGGWQAGSADDDALAGLWAWGEPLASYGTSGLLAQPGEDHSPAGFACFATGLGVDDDVDLGVTRLVSPPIDCEGLEDATLRGWLWFTNHTGAWPWEDRLRIEGSADDGESWVALETIEFGSGAWRRFSVPLEEHLALTATLRLRFVAADTLHDSTVEVLIDDLEIVTATRNETDVEHEPPPGPGVKALALSVGPNPAKESVWLRLSLPAAAEVEAVIVDAAGRVVRRLEAGRLPAGESRLAWDGRDASGAPVRSGRFWARVTTPAETAVRPIVLLR